MSPKPAAESRVTPARGVGACPGTGCPRCGYALEGLPGPGVCPGCGAPFDAREPAAVVGDAPARALDTKHPLVELLQIAAPTVATMTSFTAMQFVDGLMVSRIGPEPIYVAAQGNGGIAAFVPIATVMGLVTVVNTYVAQNLGAGRPERGSRYGWTALWLGLGAWAILLPYAIVLPALFALMDHAPELIRLESAYGRILVLGSVLTLCTRGISHYFYGMHRPMTVLVASLAGNVVNVLANYALIYGELGFPAMGVAGAALGTVLGSAVELAIPVAVFLSPAFDRRYATRAAWRPSWAHVRDVVRLGWPGALMFGNEMLCWAYFMVQLVGRFGPAHNTAGWVALRYMQLAFMPAIGISIAVTAVVGRSMGAGRPDLAARRAWLGLALNLTYMGLCALAFVIFRREAIAAFVEPGTPPEVAREVIEAGARIMVLGAVFQLFDALGITFIAALRGAGDTVWPGVVTVVLVWVCIVAGGHVIVEVAPELKSVGPWIGASAYIILLGLFVSGRFLAGAWKDLRVLEHAAGADGTPAPAS